MTDQAHHKRSRRMLDPLYTLKVLRESESLYDEPISFFTEQMRARGGQIVDMSERMVTFAVDAFTAYTYGERYGLLEQGSASDMLKFTEAHWSPYTWMVMLGPWTGILAKWYEFACVFAGVVLSGGKPPLPIMPVRY
jgi:hypothetical protein